MHPVTLLSALVLCAGGCVDTEDDTPGFVGTSTLVSYNLANATDEQALNLAAHIDELGPDLLAVQECVECEEFAESLSGEFLLAQGHRGGVGILYDSSRWEELDSGVHTLGDNDDGWGERVFVWARLLDVQTATALQVYSTHYCVPIRNDDDRCDESRQIDYTRSLLAHSKASGLPSVVGGDFNVFESFEDGAVVGEFLRDGWIDLYRSFVPEGDVTTFQGNSWAPPGRIDYIFSSISAEVQFADIDTSFQPVSGPLSDHYPVRATFRVEDTTGNSE